MFVQIIEGHTDDAAGLRRQMERWEADLRAGADGFQGSTAGVSADGHVVVAARFESEAAARANSDRPEQGDWWTDTEKYFDGEVAFADSSDVELFLGGGSDDARFVQVMKTSGVDRAELAELDEVMERLMPTARPDVLGMTRVWTAPDTTVELVYFTSEADARAAERAEMPAEMQEAMAKFEHLLAGVEFVDLTDPWLT